jgi:hypothetical protein
MIVFKKTDIGATIMIVTKSEGVVFDSQIMLEGIA